MMTYKGYAATVEFDGSVGRLHGRVVNSAPYPISTFEATDVDGLQAEFRQSIDEYLLSYQEDGIKLQRPSSGKPNVRLGPELHQSVTRSATENGLSLNKLICRLPKKAQRDGLKIKKEETKN